MKIKIDFQVYSEGIHSLDSIVLIIFLYFELAQLKHRFLYL